MSLRLAVEWLQPVRIKFRRFKECRLRVARLSSIVLVRLLADTPTGLDPY